MLLKRGAQRERSAMCQNTGRLRCIIKETCHIVEEAYYIVKETYALKERSAMCLNTGRLGYRMAKVNGIAVAGRQGHL